MSQSSRKMKQQHQLETSQKRRRASDYLDVSNSSSSSGMMVGVVPSVNVTIAEPSVETLGSDEFTLKDVNSRTNLIEMDNESELGGGGGGGSEQNLNLLSSCLSAVDPSKLLTGQSNNSSQSSFDTGIVGRFGGDNFDMIPLMPMSRSDIGINGKLTNGRAGDGRELIGGNNESRVNISSSGTGDGGGGGGGGGRSGKESIEMEVGDGEDGPHKMIHTDERWYTILAQVIVPFIIAGFGMVGAGVVLDIVQHWELYKTISAIFTLIPALLGLKGNLEMTLAARFSTQVNIGRIRDRSTIFSAVLGNFALTQAQAIVVGFLASGGALVLKLITKKSNETIGFENSLVLLAGSMSTASFASLILGGLMMFIIIASKKLNINPDNIATPIAASLGDLVTITILSYLCTFLYQIKQYIWIHVAIIVLFLILVPIFMYYSYKNDFVRDALFNGWSPIIMAMIISSTGGFIMGFAVSRYEDIAVFQPVVNGVGGNLVAIFASRLSTSLHRSSQMGIPPPWAPNSLIDYPVDTFFSKKNPESHTAVILGFMSLPGHLLFYFAITRIKQWQFNHINAATLTPSFISFYISISVLQVILLLLICYWLVHLAWRLNKDPDNICIPYLTAIGDFLGTAFLAICFHVLYLSGETRLRTT